MAEPALDDLSMEEILSSIRRIITHDEAKAKESNSGDSDSAEPKRSASSESGSTQASAEPSSSPSPSSSPARASPAQAPPTQASAESPPRESAARAPSESASSTATQASAAQASAMQAPRTQGSPLSDRLEEVERRFHSGRGVLDGIEGKIEAYAESVLRPLLSQWLRENLPSLLDRVMREEIEKAVKRLRK